MEVDWGCGGIFSVAEINSALAAAQRQRVGLTILPHTTTSSPPFCCILIYTTRPQPLHPTPVIYCLFHLAIPQAFWGAGALSALRASIPRSRCPISSRILWSFSKQSVSFPGPRLLSFALSGCGGAGLMRGHSGITGTVAGSSSLRNILPWRGMMYPSC